MSNQELLLYCIQAVIFMAASLFIYQRIFWNIGIKYFFLLYFSSIILALFSAYIGSVGKEFDSMSFLLDAKLLMKYIDSDKSLLGMFFLTGGNSLYPSSYFPALFASDTWSHYSNFTIEKFYLLFSYLSSPNLYNISLFFGLISLISKLFIIKLGMQFKLEKKWLLFLIIFLCFGGIDIYFISSLNKENILFFFFSIALYLCFNLDSNYKKLGLVIVLIQIALLRFNMFFILAACTIFIWLLYNFLKLSMKSKLTVFISLIFGCLLVIHSEILSYLKYKIDRFQLKNIGNTAIQRLDNSDNLSNLILTRIETFLGIFYTPIYSIRSYYIIIDIFNVVSIVLIIYLIYKSVKISNHIFQLSLLFIILSLVVISVFVPNYGAQLRYRAPFVVLGISILIFQQKKIY